MILRINALGLENSLRKKNDGVTYFGYIEDEEVNNNNDNQNQKDLDFILKPKDNDYDEKYL